jgi:hypothetical protein
MFYSSTLEEERRTMKSALVICLLGICLVGSSVSAQERLIIAWNELGMHCSNKDFSKLVILPPYNNVRAQVVQVGDSSHNPAVLTADLRVTYEIPGNTYSVGKTNFWDYEDQIFGVNLPPNIGLTGKGLTGEMRVVENYFLVEGVPITPYTDADLFNEDPFQLGLIKAHNMSDSLLASTQPVVPVSNEINCVSAGCHSSETAILNAHDAEGGFDPNATPILCANCHASNALGMPGQPGLPSLSEAVHKRHGGETNDCYKCHPGPNTQCLRDVMSTRHGMVCQTCHGSVTQVGESISNGRVPWLEEPRCGDPACHGPVYAEETGKLFRQSRGHGNLFCSACHGEPHAIAPSRVNRDNVQNIALQGSAGTLHDCTVCHTVVPSQPGPHGLSATHCCVTMGNVDRSIDGLVTMGDLTVLIDHLYISLAPLVCNEEGNTDLSTDGLVTMGDLTVLIDHLYISLAPLPPCP